MGWRGLLTAYDISSVEAFLEEMANREEGALVVELPRAPGARENRWVHLLSGEPYVESVSPVRSNGSGASAHNTDDLRNRVVALEAEVAELRVIVARISVELGIQ
jgi:uncharacterized protein YceH (UPF0502 family)